jgi:phosphoglycerate kinase
MALSEVTRFSELDLAARRVFLRIDLDSPLTGDGRLASSALPTRLLPALRALLALRCKVVLAGHARRGGAAVDALAERLHTLLSVPIVPFGRNFPAEIPHLLEGQIGLTPNLNLYPEERKNDAGWALRIARSVDVYVSEAPLAAQEIRASTVALPRFMPARGAGPTLDADLEMSREFLENATSPYTAIVGGSGLQRKAPFLRALVNRVDTLLLGGVVASTFLVAGGWTPRETWFEADGLAVAREIMETAERRGVRVLLPSDAVTLSRRAGAQGEFEQRELGALAPDEALLDIGDATRKAYADVLARSETVLWNGHLGAAESPATLEGTAEIARVAAEAATYSGIVGESTVARAISLGLAKKFRWVTKSGAGAIGLFADGDPPGLVSLTPARASATETAYTGDRSHRS